ncbi:PQ loop repeat-domain-containing protein [Lentinula aff. lateritia]|uniref:PQ loop repeat-domain-containing protein n=1 Tax=Lentinula aff. lateritia TaxID=2804960 RepID=A0ACC1UE22_9AGAR|nr:PQ loop repeat-domain-containing protein [Lentinula aff. lateritia]
MASLPDFSVFLGYTSILCWLGAQFPQVLENIHRRSCEGLALPFLANWLLGDISNLIGCILTKQLPFQTWLAAYFVSVDLALVGQYVYYQRVNPPPSRARSRIRPMSVGDRQSPRYRRLSAVASNVAAAAALAAQHEEHSAPRRAHRWPQSSRDTFFESSESRISRDDGDDVEEGALSALADSFHSERGQTLGNKQVPWNTERQRRGTSVGRYPALTRSAYLPPLHTSTFDNSADSTARGRTLQREPGQGHMGQALPSTSVGRSSRVSKQSAGMVFLGVFAMFGLGSFTAPRHIGSLVNGSITGRVLSLRAMNSLDRMSPTEHVAPSSLGNEYASIDIHTITSIPQTTNAPPFEPKIIEDSNERIVGRIFAWVCTTLYLTSRLPQIWKNYVRKSVEGLSMYLFIFAFLGNTFYVASILTSPEVYQPAPRSTDFIKESIPYLLGSGGTLVFDLTIVTQSFIYRTKPRRHRSRSRPTAEEESGLLAGDILAHPPQEEINAHSRTRTA